MANYTENYNLIKPTKNEQYDIEDVTNTNMDIIDAELINCIKKDGNKVLSQNDFTDEYKKKVDEIKNVSGLEGATFTPSVSEEGILSWTNNKNLNNPEPVNIVGKDGRKIIVNPETFNITSNNPKTCNINTPDLDFDEINVNDLVISFTKTADNKDYLCVYDVSSKSETSQYVYLVCKSCIDITPKPGEKGEKGDPGANGKDGTNGHTPEKGTDYYTEAEKTELVNEVVAKVNEDIGLILDEINGEVV